MKTRLKPLSNGVLRLKFETHSQMLRLVSNALPQDTDSPGQFALWEIISELQDLESHYAELDSQDAAEIALTQKAE